ncbi:MAG: hypothetical protein ACQEXJ_19660 [Myxococcota bacterium]
MGLLSFERRWLLAAFETILPGGVGPMLPADVGERTAGFVDELFVRAPTETLVGVRAALWLVTLGPLLWRLKLRPFHRLRPADRVAFLEALEGSRVHALRELPALLKLLACTARAGLPSTQRAAGQARPDATPPEWARASDRGARS